MLTKGINFVNFKIKKNSPLVKKNLISILKSKKVSVCPPRAEGITADWAPLISIVANSLLLIEKVFCLFGIGKILTCNDASNLNLPMVSAELYQDEEDW